MKRDKPSKQLNSRQPDRPDRLSNGIQLDKQSKKQPDKRSQKQSRKQPEKPNGLSRISSRVLAVTLAATLASSLLLTGCGSLSRLMEEPAPPLESAPAPELTNLVRAGEEYEGIEILHGTWDEPCYTEDRKGYFYEEDGWIYLHIEGDPAERGYQHGWLLADYIQQSVDINTSMLADFRAIDWTYFKENAQRMWADKVSKELRAELEGIIAGATERGATVDYLDLLVLNGLEELRDCWFPTVQEDYYRELVQGLWNPVISISGTAVVDGELVAGIGEDENEADAEAAATREAAADTNADGADTGDNAASGAGIKDIAADETDTSEAAPDEAAASGTTQADSGTLPQYTEHEGIMGTGQGGLPEPVAASGNAGGPGGYYLRQASVLLATGSATEDGGIILAQNTIAAYADYSFSNVMIDVAPSAGERFAMQAAPGLIHSASEAYSTESLLVANTLIKGFNVYSEEGTPEFLRIRQAVQGSKTLDEFVSVMTEGNNGGLASSWLVGELETGQIMELELGLAFYLVKKLDNGWLLSTNGVDDVRIQSLETDGSATTDIRLGARSRFSRLSDRAGIYQGKLTPALAEEIVSDHFDAYQNKMLAGSRSICAHFDTDKALNTPDASVEPYMPYGTVDAKVMSTELARDHTIYARWGSACGRSFDSASFLAKNTQYIQLQGYLFDRPSQPWATLYPLDEKE